MSVSHLLKTSQEIHQLETGRDYRVLHVLGEGAYGTVASAIHQPSGMQVAIKKVLPFEHT